MDSVEKARIIERYETRQRTLGAGVAALGEPKGRQAFFFDILLGFAEFKSCRSVLDLGCGYGDLSAWLAHRAWPGRYVGIDIVPALVEEGRRRHPAADLRVHDIQAAPLGETFDWVMAAGALGSETTEIDYYDHLAATLEAAWRHCRVGMSFDLFSPLAEFRNPIHHHVDFNRLVDVIRRITRRFVIRHDYMPFALAVCLLRDDEIDRSLSIFQALRPHFDALEGK